MSVTSPTTMDKGTPTETEKLFANLDKPSLGALSYALRHPDTWPEGFIWDYSDCDQCAMGLAHRLWQNNIPRVGNETGRSVMASRFAMPYEDAAQIFFMANRRQVLGLFSTLLESVTPEMVADKIDAYLARAE